MIAYRARHWFAFTPVGLKLTHWRLDLTCWLRGCDWQPLSGRQEFCMRCLRTKGEN